MGALECGLCEWAVGEGDGRRGRLPSDHHLQQAIAAGFDDWERLHNSPHLAAIRDTAVWQAFENRLREKQIYTIRRLKNS